MSYASVQGFDKQKRNRLKLSANAHPPSHKCEPTVWSEEFQQHIRRKGKTSMMANPLGNDAQILEMAG